MDPRQIHALHFIKDATLATNQIVKDQTEQLTPTLEKHTWTPAVRGPEDRLSRWTGAVAEKPHRNGPRPPLLSPSGKGETANIPQPPKSVKGVSYKDFARFRTPSLGTHPGDQASAAELPNRFVREPEFILQGTPPATTLGGLSGPLLFSRCTTGRTSQPAA
jgi:hypothetical protein